MKALFVLRHNNDFDSMTSVVDGWVRLSDHHRAIVYVTSSDLKWRGDYRTAMLEETGRVTFFDFWTVAGLGNGGYLAEHWQTNKPDERVSRRILHVATELRVAPGFSSKMTKFIDELSPDIIAFDSIRIRPRRKLFDFFGYQEILAWSKKNARPLVSLPHGLLLFSFEEKNKKDWTNYDAIFVESDRKKEIFSDGVADKVIVSGSPRYDPSWVKRIADRLAADTPEPSAKRDKVNMVFFATKEAKYFRFPDLLAWLAHLASHPDVELVVQPHPRGQRESAFSSIANLPNVRIDPYTPASSLIGEADIVSTLVSSVVVEAIVRKQEILYPKFLSAAETQFDEVGACIALSSMEQTHPAIDKYQAGNRVARKNYDEFLRRFVYGNGDPQVIKRICDKMDMLAAGKHRSGNDS
ncbi:MAG: hypothetical protein AAF362_08360 [Pseudomonadota bacterium]